MIPCVTDIRGTIYPSQKAAAAALGVTPGAVAQALYRRGNCHRVGLGPQRYGNTNAKARAVNLFNLQFRSIKAASNALGVSRATIRRFLEPDCLPSTYSMVYAAVLTYGEARDAAARTARSLDE